MQADTKPATNSAPASSSSSSPDPIVIVGLARTPMGAFQGDFATLSASDLGAVAIRAAIARAGIPAEKVEEVWLGNCLMAGQGQAPARQAAIKAGVPVSAGAVTLSKMCGSAMQAVRFACDALAAGSSDVIVAGGMESMTNAPYLVPKARGGYRIGHGMLLDHMMLDGLKTPMPGTTKAAAARWAPSPKTAPPSTASRGKRKTPSRSNRCGAPRPLRPTAPSIGKLRR
jgi:acetyl-CoA C-acetyltransferase